MELTDLTWLDSIRVTTTLNTTFEGTLFTADPLTNLIAINTAPIPPTPSSASTSPQPGDYQVIPISKLQSFQLLALAPEVISATQDGGVISFENAVPEIKPVDWAAIQRRERAAIERVLKKERARGRGVSKEAQSIYDALSRTYVMCMINLHLLHRSSLVVFAAGFRLSSVTNRLSRCYRLPVRWQNQSIIVLEVVVIEPPYGPENCRATNKDPTALQRVKKVVRLLVPFIRPLS